MADTLESLEIEVKHNARGADTEISKVVAQVKELSKALSAAIPAMKQYAEALGGVGKVGSGGGKSSRKKKNPLSEEMRETIAEAGKYEIAVHKMAVATKKMGDAFNSGNENSAWREREKQLNASIQASKNMHPVPLSAGVSNKIEAASEIEVLQSKLESLQRSMQDAFAKGDSGKAYELRGKIIKVEEAIERLSGSAEKAKTPLEKLKDAANRLATSASKAHKPLSNFIESLKRIAFYRFIRSIIKSITQAFQEGLQNAYAFSAGIVGEGHRFAEAMDSMKSASTEMKSQIGSAFISLLAAIAPVVIQIINLVTRLADAIAQIFAAFTGSTYLKANAVADHFADTMKAGGAAAKEWKNQLLGFDEINRLNEPSGGGGGGGASGLNPADMFTETPIAQKWLDFANKVKETLQWIKDHMELIKGLAIAIGAALIAWKVANIVGSLLGISGAMGSIAGGVALVTAGFAALGVGLYQWITTGELTSQTFWLIEGGILAVGAGLSLLTGSWIPLAVAAVVGAVFAIITKWDELKAALQKLQEKISSTLGNCKFEWLDLAAIIVQCLMAPIDSIIRLIGWIQSLVSWVATAIDALNNLAWVKNANARAQASWDDGSIWNGMNFASGGFPDEGQLFVAREAGPEMVGTIGGRTAVANNDDIVEGIRTGVFEAVSAAMGGNNGGTQFKLYLDSKEIKYGLQKLDRAWGA